MVIAWVDLMLPMLLHHSLKGAGKPDILIQTGRCPGKGHTEHAIQTDRLQWCKSIVFRQMERSAIGAGCNAERYTWEERFHFKSPPGHTKKS